jgi:hypothetical protein
LKILHPVFKDTCLNKRSVTDGDHLQMWVAVYTSFAPFTYNAEPGDTNL